MPLNIFDKQTNCTWNLWMANTISQIPDDYKNPFHKCYLGNHYILSPIPHTLVIHRIKTRSKTSKRGRKERGRQKNPHSTDIRLCLFPPNFIFIHFQVTHIRHFLRYWVKLIEWQSFRCCHEILWGIVKMSNIEKQGLHVVRFV